MKGHCYVNKNKAGTLSVSQVTEYELDDQSSVPGKDRNFPPHLHI